MEQVFSEESDEGGGIDETAPPKPSRGPDIEFPLQRKDIDLLIEAFRKKKVSQIRDKYLIHLCIKQTIKIFSDIFFCLGSACDARRLFIIASAGRSLLRIPRDTGLGGICLYHRA